MTDPNTIDEKGFGVVVSAGEFSKSVSVVYRNRILVAMDGHPQVCERDHGAWVSLVVLPTGCKIIQKLKVHPVKTSVSVEEVEFSAEFFVINNEKVYSGILGYAKVTPECTDIVQEAETSGGRLVYGKAKYNSMFELELLVARVQTTPGRDHSDDDYPAAPANKDDQPPSGNQPDKPSNSPEASDDDQPLSEDFEAPRRQDSNFEEPSQLANDGYSTIDDPQNTIMDYKDDYSEFDDGGSEIYLTTEMLSKMQHVDDLNELNEINNRQLPENAVRRVPFAGPAPRPKSRRNLQRPWNTSVSSSGHENSFNASAAQAQRFTGRGGLRSTSQSSRVSELPHWQQNREPVVPTGGNDVPIGPRRVFSKPNPSPVARERAPIGPTPNDDTDWQDVLDEQLQVKHGVAIPTRHPCQPVQPQTGIPVVKPPSVSASSLNALRQASAVQASPTGTSRVGIGKLHLVDPPHSANRNRPPLMNAGFGASNNQNSPPPLDPGSGSRSNQGHVTKPPLTDVRMGFGKSASQLNQPQQQQQSNRSSQSANSSANLFPKPSRLVDPPFPKEYDPKPSAELAPKGYGQPPLVDVAMGFGRSNIQPGQGAVMGFGKSASQANLPRAAQTSRPPSAGIAFGVNGGFNQSEVVASPQYLQLNRCKSNSQTDVQYPPRTRPPSATIADVSQSVHRANHVSRPPSTQNIGMPSAGNNGLNSTNPPYQTNATYQQSAQAQNAEFMYADQPGQPQQTTEAPAPRNDDFMSVNQSSQPQQTQVYKQHQQAEAPAPRNNPTSMYADQPKPSQPPTVNAPYELNIPTEVFLQRNAEAISRPPSTQHVGGISGFGQSTPSVHRANQASRPPSAQQHVGGSSVPYQSNAYHANPLHPTRNAEVLQRPKLEPLSLLQIYQSMQLRTLQLEYTHDYIDGIGVALFNSAEIWIFFVLNGNDKDPPCLAYDEVPHSTTYSIGAFVEGRFWRLFSQEMPAPQVLYRISNPFMARLPKADVFTNGDRVVMRNVSLTYTVEQTEPRTDGYFIKSGNFGLIFVPNGVKLPPNGATVTLRFSYIKDTDVESYWAVVNDLPNPVKAGPTPVPVPAEIRQ
uniref:LsmAD domain-containing protein n=1 Tax=Panagrellus redivivus TaxID=6233 RepID=A0A7E4UNE2_PANRE